MNRCIASKKDGARQSANDHRVRLFIVQFRNDCYAVERCFLREKVFWPK